MDVQDLLARIFKDFKTSEGYQTLSSSEKLEFDKLLNQVADKATLGKKQPRIGKKRINSRLTYQLKIRLSGIRPPIWRRILVPGNITFHQLHNVIQCAMGWDNYHLYSFMVNKVQIEELNDQDMWMPSVSEQVDSNKARLAEWVNEEKAKFTYTYDFGDNWDHIISVEKIDKADGKLDYPVCLKGKRACPPEDCGGVYGYMLLIDEDIENDEYGEEYQQELQEYYGNIDPEKFNLNEVNELLKEIKL